MLDLYSCESQLLWKLSLMDNSPLNKQLQNQRGFRITSCRQGKWKWQSEDCKGLFKSVYSVIFSADLPAFFFHRSVHLPGGEQLYGMSPVSPGFVTALCGNNHYSWGCKTLCYIFSHPHTHKFHFELIFYPPGLCPFQSTFWILKVYFECSW